MSMESWLGILVALVILLYLLYTLLEPENF